MDRSRVVESTDAPLQKIVLVDADGKILARPSYPVVSSGSHVRFINYSGTTITLNFHRGLFGDTNTITLGDLQKDTLAIGTLGNGAYEYTGVTAEDIEVTGESSPKIIIDD